MRGASRLGFGLLVLLVVMALVPVSSAHAAASTLPRLRCTQWTFIPPQTTVCHRGTPDTIAVQQVNGRVLAYSGGIGRWVEIPYTFQAKSGRLELDARKLHVAEPPIGKPFTTYQLACRGATVDPVTNAVTCTSTRAQRVTARLDVTGGAARIWDAAGQRYATSAYRWDPSGGYLRIAGQLIPGAVVTLGPSMVPAADWTTTDHVVRCSGGSVTATVTERAGGQVTIDGAPVAPGPVTIPLTPGQSVRWTLSVPGLAPVEQQARCLPDDFPAWSAEGNGSSTVAWRVMAPDLGAGSAPGGGPHYLVVADRHGTPVWWRGVHDLRPLDAKVTDDGLLQWGEAGYTYSYDSHYHQEDWTGSEQAVLGTGLGLDHHELQPAGDGTYWGIRYVNRDCPGSDCVDMTAFGGSAAATLVEGEIVHFNAAGTVLWSWRMRDHVGLSEWAALDSPDLRSQSRLDNAGQDYWDIHHLNSVEPDGDGVIVSARHLSAVFRIRLSDGGIDWKLSGTPRPESLTVLGADRHPLFDSQHDARRLTNGNLSVFDNGSVRGRAPRVAEVAVDPATRTARVVHEVLDSRVPASGCCGGARKTTAGWLIAWGGQGLVTETDSLGTALLSIHTGDAFTYRAFPVPAGLVQRATLLAGMDAQHPRSP